MNSPIAPVSNETLEEAALLVRERACVVAYPTETVYGLAAHGLDARALENLARLKGRDARQPVALLVADPSMLEDVVSVVPSRARQLMERHWPGPLTLVMPARADLSPLLRSPTGGVGVRMSSDPVARRLVELVGAPITATSANRSGEPAAISAWDASQIEGLALVLDGGQRAGRPSTVVELLDDTPRVLRAGDIVLEIE